MTGECFDYVSDRQGIKESAAYSQLVARYSRHRAMSETSCFSGAGVLLHAVLCNKWTAFEM